METIQLIILQASEGHKLYNKEHKAIGVNVQLAATDSVSNWEEITNEEADKLMKEWEEEMEKEGYAMDENPLIDIPEDVTTEETLTEE